MGPHKEGNDGRQESKRCANGYVALVWTFLVSMVGGSILGLWEWKYRPSNSQLWMIPFGLILFVTPVMIWFAVFVSKSSEPIDDIEDPGRSEL